MSLIEGSSQTTRSFAQSLRISQSIPRSTIIRRRTWSSGDCRRAIPPQLRLLVILPEHRRGAERLREVSQAIETVLADRIIPRQTVDNIIRDFIGRERQHIAMEERVFFPAAIKALQPQDWSEIVSTLTEPKRDPLFSDIVEQRFDVVRNHILRLEQEAEAERA
jgi:hypothetical protein